MNRPLAIAFILFIAGILFAHHIAVSFIAVIGLTGLSFILLLVFKKKTPALFYIATACLIFLLGSASYLNFNNLPPNHVVNLIKDKPQPCYVQGVVASAPDYSWMRWGRRRCSFILKARAYREGSSWVKISGLSRVNIKDSESEYFYGDTLLISGRLKRPSPPANPGEFDYAGYLRSEGVYAIIESDSDEDIITLESAHPLIPKRLIFKVRADIERLISKNLPARDAAVLEAMLIAKRKGLSGELRDAFVKTGTAHILAISGLHVAIISAIIFFIFRLIRIPAKISGALAIIFLMAYALLTGMRPPILRATIMIGVYLLGYILERDFDIYSALSLAGIIILSMNPMQLFKAGFVLSFACVFSICYLTPKLESFLIPILRAGTWPERLYENTIARYILRLILGSLAVYIGVWPLIGYYFNIVSPVTVLANLFVVPLLGVVLFLGIALVSAAALFAPLGLIFSYPLHFALSLLVGIISFLSGIRFGYFHIPDLPLYFIALYYIFILAVINRKGLALNWIRITAAGILVVNILVWGGLFTKTDRLRVTFLDLAGGESVFLEFPDGKTILINAGRRKGDYLNQGQAITLPFIWSRGRRSIDAVFLTRSDSSYLGAMLSVLEKVRPGYFISWGLDDKNRWRKRLRELILSKKIKEIKLKERSRIEGFDDVQLLAISPSRLRLTYKQATFSFSPEGNTLQLGEGQPQAINTKGLGAITIVTDGLSCCLDHYRAAPERRPPLRLRAD